MMDLRDTEPQAQAEMPRYQSHKKVWALKIKNILSDKKLAEAQGRPSSGGGIIVPEDSLFAPFSVDQTYMEKHDPKVGGYYVVYEDGYKSWSPAEAFESGYTKLP